MGWGGGVVYRSLHSVPVCCRGFGVHMSKVRSVTLDTWEPELVKVMLELGNAAVNRVYEANVDEAVAKRATPTCSRYACSTHTLV